MKKSLWIALILMLVCILSFSACDQEDTPPNNNDTPSTQQPSDNNDDKPIDNNTSGDTNTQCQHTWGEWLTVKHATCKDEGQLIRVCSKCSISEQTTVAKTETHTEVIDAAISATCTVDGKTEGKHCSVCGITLVEQTTIKAKGHTEVVDKAVAATCKVEGKTEGKHCSVCNDVIVKQDVVPKSDHIEVIDEAVSPTCTSEGKTEGKHCSVCNKVIIAQTSIDTIAHTFDSGACTMCKCIDVDSKNTEINAENERHEQNLKEIEENHEYWISYAQKEINSIKSEYGIGYVYDIDYCYEQLAELDEEIELLKKYITVYSSEGFAGDASIAAKVQKYKVELREKMDQRDIYNAHITINEWQDEIDLEESALSDDISGENRRHRENLDAINAKYECAVNGHTVVVDEAVAPTCTATGKTEGSHCSNCGFVIAEQTTVESLGHNEIVDKAVAPTCTTTGLEEGSHCSVCHKTLIVQELIVALGHSYDNGVVTTEPTCTVLGVRTFTCNICGDTDTDAIPLIEHNEVVDKAVTPTCIATGLTEGSHCSVCHKTLIAQELLVALGHSYDDGVVTTEPTCTVLGVRTFTCDICGDTDTDAIPLIKHNEVVDKAVTPTCIATGLTEGSHCSICNEILIVQETVPLIDCVGGDWIIDKAATLTEKGKKHTECMVCGELVLEEVIPVLIPSEGLVFEINDDGQSYSVTGIGSCTDTELVIPDLYDGLPVTNIGNQAFKDCSKIISVIIPNSVTNIDKSAFAWCSSLTNVKFAEKGRLMSIGEHAFWSCKSLVIATIPNSVTSIGNYAFMSCESLTYVTIGNSVTSIGEYAFNYCTSLTAITIPNSVTDIGYSAFEHCTSLTSIIIPDSVTVIDALVFGSCTSLISVTIPDSVTSIGNYAFMGCTLLTSINYNGTIEQWNSIRKIYTWNYNVSATEITCIDGTISLK